MLSMCPFWGKVLYAYMQGPFHTAVGVRNIFRLKFTSRWPVFWNLTPFHPEQTSFTNHKLSNLRSSLHRSKKMVRIHTVETHCLLFSMHPCNSYHTQTQMMAHTPPLPTIPPHIYPSPQTPQWLATLPCKSAVSLLTAIFFKAQTPAQRRANEKFAKREESKRGRPESVVNAKKEKFKPPVSPILLGWYPPF